MMFRASYVCAVALAACFFTGCSEDSQSDDAAAGALTDGNEARPEIDADAQMKAIVARAKLTAGGKRPGGWCYMAVAKDIDAVGYGYFPKQPASAIGNFPAVPWNYKSYARNFAEFLDAPDRKNGGTNADRMGVKKLPLDNPYLAPAGALVVVRAGTPGTSHPTAGDITVAIGNGRFLNDGEMGYGGSANFKPGNNFVLGIYVPITYRDPNELPASDDEDPFVGADADDAGSASTERVK